MRLASACSSPWACRPPPCSTRPACRCPPSQCPRPATRPVPPPPPPPIPRGLASASGVYPLPRELSPHRRAHPPRQSRGCHHPSTSDQRRPRCPSEKDEEANHRDTEGTEKTRREEGGEVRR